MRELSLVDNLSFRYWIAYLSQGIGALTLAIAAGPLITLVYRLSRSEDTQLGSFSLAQGVRGLLCLAMFASLCRARRVCLLEHPLIRPLTLLAGYAVLTAVISPYSYENIAFAVKVLFLCLAFAIAFNLSEQRLCGERWLAGCSWTVLTLVVISQITGSLMGNTVTVYHSAYATAGLIDQASIAAAYSISTMPITLKAFPDDRLSVIGVTAQLACVFLTMRRTELIAAVVAVCFVFCFALAPFRRHMSWQKVTVAVLAICTFAAIALSSPAGADLMTRFQDLDPSQGTGSGRYVFWRVGLDHAANRRADAQIFGDGMGAVRDVMDRELGMAIGCHNDWLDMMNSFGFVGLALLGWWYLALLRFVITMHRIDHPAFRGGLSAFVMLSLVSFGTGRAFDPSFIVIYAALGFWAAQPLWSEPYEYAACASC